MSDSDHDLIEAERALLRSARLDEQAIPREAHRRILAGLGIAGALSSVTSVASGTASAFAISSATRVTVLAVIKWTAIGATGGVLALGAAHQLERAPSAAPFVSAPAVSHQRPQPPRGVDPSPAPPPEIPPSETAPLSILATPSRDNMPSPVADERTPALAAEVQSLDRVRSALATGDGSAALALLDAHRLTFSNGHLAPEATYLRVQALVKTGNRPAASDLARRFLASFPRSPQAAALRALALEQDSGAHP